MARLINIRVEKCGECPFCVYDAHYDMSADSGYNCEHPDATRYRIIDEGVLDSIIRKIREYNESQHTLFPIKENLPENPLNSFPEWCPLQEEQDEN